MLCAKLVVCLHGASPRFRISLHVRRNASFLSDVRSFGGVGGILFAASVSLTYFMSFRFKVGVLASVANEAAFAIAALSTETLSRLRCRCPTNDPASDVSRGGFLRVALFLRFSLGCVSLHLRKSAVRLPQNVMETNASERETEKELASKSPPLVVG